MDEEIIKYREYLNPVSGSKNYFDFEEDFIEKNIRCIPMIVRFKMDTAGIKLKLSEWSRFTLDERIKLATMPAYTTEEIKHYKNFLVKLVSEYTGNEVTPLPEDKNPVWANIENVPTELEEKIKELNVNIAIGQWADLTNLQRFALLKLCRTGHEAKNFPKAIREFGLLNK